MKKYIYILLIVSTFISCDDELEQTNPNVVTQENFWKTGDDVLSGLAATYKMFRHIDNGYWGVRGVELTNGRGDDFFIRNDVKALYELSTFSNTPSTGTPTSIFTGCYTGIFRANQIIDNIGTVEVSDADKEKFVAEAKFLRALNYFHLVINYGAVPIFTSVPQTREEYFIQQSPESEVWVQIENDFKEAAANLPVTYPSQWVGRATKGAAIGYLGKVYLYQQKWEDAVTQFSTLTTPTGMPKAPYNYDLLADFQENFLPGNDNNIESLFEIQNQNVGGTEPWAGENANESQGVTTAQEFAPTEVGGWFEAHPTEKIFQEFQEEKTTDGDFDPRMYASLIWDYPGATFYNIPYAEFSSPFGYSAKIKKYQNWFDDNEGIWISEINEKALRFADVLLMYAEALTMQGRSAEAVPLVNRIRERASLSAIAALGQTEMMEEIRHQRMIEFFREGLRFYDLKRWGLIEQEINNSDKVGKEFLVLPKHAYFPIPQSEMNTNPNIDQNPDW
ncbi:RagB/SusD family nutrient uptake outer membrane protein [Galbibacter sp. PAP.153]|uniref:RagB/SusD family nutrient uptake outer membrane protein n=1 Tax=Galbibacter sp. PAP.153 TaxID=3104623 RepID=UPI003009D5FC